jgi:formate dehydrogenase iron-sulfur subunit
MSKSVLVDLNRCMGCRACQVACKAWNDNPGEVTLCLGCYDNPPDFSGDTWSLIRFNEVEESSGKLHWVFTKRQCMHCVHPACVSACPVSALEKLDDGPVVYDAKKCIGCRYCMLACPFHVPRVHWDRVFPLIKKCTFCADRQSNGMEPACVKACPTDALVYGEREALIAEAEARIQSRPDKYANHVYGKEEAGGTSWMYISPVPFKELGFPELDSEPVPELSEALAIYGTPSMLVGVTALLGGLYWFTKRRAEGMAKQGQGKKEA